MSPIIVASIVSGSAVLLSSAVALTGVIITSRAQTRRIDADNKARLDAQTGEIKAHVTRTERT